MRIAFRVGAAALAGCAVLLWANFFGHREKTPLRIMIDPQRIRANGYDTALLSIESDSSRPPAISVTGNTHTALLERVRQQEQRWQARIRARIVPGTISVRVESDGHMPASAQMTTFLDPGDSSGDGTPDFLHLDDESDQKAFRNWFTYVAEAQYFQAPGSRPAEIIDCAALIRYAYRQALRAHDSSWAKWVHLPLIPSYDSVRKYDYPYTPLGPALFRVTAGPFHAIDLNNGSYLEFADAKTLRRYNTFFVSRDLLRALPGDLLFYRQESDHVTYHSMIYLGRSHFSSDGQFYVLYHTGPVGKGPGEIRRLTVDQLRRFPQPEWRPIGPNFSYLGVSRWNILR